MLYGVYGCAHAGGIGDYRVSEELQRLQRAVSSLLMSRSTGVTHDDGHKAKIRTMAAGDVDPDLSSDSHDEKGLDAAVAQRHV
jgi:hypothetical protein